MQLPKTDCIFEISIKKVCWLRKKNKLKIDTPYTRNNRNNTKCLCASYQYWKNNRLQLAS